MGTRTLPMKHFTWRTILAACVITALSITTWQYIKNNNNEAQLQQQLQHKIIELEKTKSKSKSIQDELIKTKKELEAKRAKQSSDRAYALSIESYIQPVSTCGTPKQCIYLKESGNSTTALNSIGCRGLGQACPGSKLPCGDDYACQDAWFSNYAIQRYGSWEKAWQFWQANRWW